MNECSRQEFNGILVGGNVLESVVMTNGVYDGGESHLYLGFKSALNFYGGRDEKWHVGFEQNAS